jgi:hypothetical protein
MNTASVKNSFWNRRPSMASVETAWPTVQLGAIGEAWRLYRRHWGVWSLTMLVSIVGVAIGEGIGTLLLRAASLGMLGGLIGLGDSGVPILPVILGTIIAGFFLGGMIRMAVNQVRGRQPHLSDLTSITDVWFDLALGSGLLGLFLYVGWHLLVIPGLIVGGLLMFMYPLIVDARLPATGAILQSYHALKTQWLIATVVHLAVTAVAGLGGLLGGIGLVVTGPIYALSIAVMYRDLFLNPYSPTWAKPREPFEEF